MLWLIINIISILQERNKSINLSKTRPYLYDSKCVVWLQFDNRVYFNLFYRATVNEFNVFNYWLYLLIILLVSWIDFISLH